MNALLVSRRTNLIVCFIAITFGLLSCSYDKQSKGDEAYAGKINDWHLKRIASLKEDDGWLSLAGLYPLKEGAHAFGADSSSDMVFPPKAPDHIGWFSLKAGQISVRIKNGIEVLNHGAPVTETILKSDADGEPTTLTLGSLKWYVIKRGGEFFVRLKDKEHPNFASFKGIDRYPVSKQWRVKASFVGFDEPKTIGIPNILGQVNEEPLYGALEFTLEGETYRLAPLGDPGSDSFFIIFGDETNGEETYGGGRFVYADTPDENGITYIDFNKSYNPPCVFTGFATCPLPPAQNRLQVKITAGEKNYGQAGQDH